MRITSKGQVTIPQAIREQLGLLPDTEVEFAVERGAAVLRPKKGVPTHAQQIVGALEGPRLEDADEQQGAAGALERRAG